MTTNVGHKVFVKRHYVDIYITLVVQVEYGQSEEGVRYVVDSFYQNEGVPYADSFYTVVRFSLRATSETTSEVRYEHLVVYHTHI